MRQRNVLVASIVWLAAGLLAPGMAGPSGWAVAQEPQLVSGGQAFGTFVTLEGVAQTQKSSVVGMGCAVTPLFRENSAPGVDLPLIGSVSQIHTTAERIQTASMIRGTTTATIEDISLLGGIITGDLLKAVATTRHDASGFAAHATGTQFVNLTILGLPIPINPAPNTVIDLPLIGSVALNERVWIVQANRAKQQTTMLRVEISLPNVLGIPVGTEVIVGSASSEMKNTIVRLGGGANGGSVTLGDIGLLGPLFPQGMWCGGTNGQWLVNTGVVGVLPGVLTTGTVENRIKGSGTPTSVDATARSTIEAANLLAGLVMADVLVAGAHLHGAPGNLTRKFWGTQIVGLQVAGFPEIGDGVPFNTHLDVVGLGDLWLKRAVMWPGAVQMRLIQLLVLENNGLGLPVGADVRVGSATVTTAQ